MLISQSGGANSLVVALFNRSQNQVLALTSSADPPQHLSVFVMIGRSPDDQRDINGISHFFDYLGGFLSATVKSVGVSADQLQSKSSRPVIIDALLCPGNRVIGYSGKGLERRLRPLVGRTVPDLHGYSGQVRHLAFKQVKGIAGLATNGDCLTSLYPVLSL